MDMIITPSSTYPDGITSDLLTRRSCVFMVLDMIFALPSLVQHSTKCLGLFQAVGERIAIHDDFLQCKDSNQNPGPGIE